MLDDIFEEGSLMTSAHCRRAPVTYVSHFRTLSFFVVVGRSLFPLLVFLARLPCYMPFDQVPALLNA